MFYFERRLFETSDPIAIFLHMLPNSSLKERSKLLQWLSFGVSELRPFHSPDCKKDRRKAEYVGDTLGGIERCLQGQKFLTGDDLTLADAMTALELWPIMKWAATEKYKRLREWHQIVFDLESIKDSGISLLSVDKPSKLSKQVRGSKVPVKKEEGRKLKVLCLHGYRQNGVTFREKLGAFRKLVGKHVDLFFFSSPVKVPPSTEDEVSQSLNFYMLVFGKSDLVGSHEGRSPRLVVQPTGA